MADWYPFIQIWNMTALATEKVIPYEVSGVSPSQRLVQVNFNYEMTTARGTGQIVDITSARFPELEFMAASQAEVRRNVDLVFALVRTSNGTSLQAGPAGSTSTGMVDNLVLMLSVADYSNPAVIGSFAISGYSVSHHPLDDYPMKAEVRFKKYGDAYKMFFVSSYRHPVFEIKSIDFSTHAYNRADMEETTGPTGITNAFGATSLLLVDDFVYTGGNARYNDPAYDQHYYPLFAKFKYDFTELDVFLTDAGPLAYSIDALALRPCHRFALPNCTTMVELWP